MTGAAGLSSINCTQCGAGLSVLGGGRVLSHICGYCGAVLDAQDNYKILTSIGKRDNPYSPVKIGMTLSVDGAEFTVIGTLGMVERYRGQVWRWTEHQLFSATHGYAWLSYEEGNFVFTRKLRRMPNPSWITLKTVNNADTPPRAWYGRKYYRYYETVEKELDFIEGEFNWVPELGAKTTSVTLMSSDAMLSYSQTPTEREVERSTLLDRAATLADLGIDPNAIPGAKHHPLTPFRPFAHEGFVRTTLLGFAAASLLLAMTFAVIGGSTVLRTDRLAVDRLPQSIPFELSNTAQLVRVDLQSDVNNAYALFSTEITGPDGQPLVAAARATQFYTGVEGGERWREGSRNARYLFRAEAPGVHEITLDLEEAESWRGSHVPVREVTLRIREGQPTYFWMVIATVGFILGAGALVARRAVHEKRRWMGSDWTDE